MLAEEAETDEVGRLQHDMDEPATGRVAGHEAEAIRVDGHRHVRGAPHEQLGDALQDVPVRDDGVEGQLRFGVEVIDQGVDAPPGGHGRRRSPPRAVGVSTRPAGRG